MNQLQTCIDEDRLCYNAWEREEEGRQLLCWFTAIAGKGVRPTSCPSSLMPRCIAHLLPAWADNVSVAQREPLVRRVAALDWETLGRLNAQQTRRLDCALRRVPVEYALPHAGDATPEVEAVIALLRRGEAGDEPSEQEWLTAAWAVWAAEAWAEAAARAAGAEAAAWAEAAARAAGAEAAAEAAAWNAITALQLDAIEAFCATEGDKG
jgi:hypothetical protein